MAEGISKAKEAKDKDVVFFLGNLGSGKSTTIAYLMGAPIWSHRVEGKPVLDIQGDPTGYPKIGHGFVAETSYPAIYPINNHNFGDLPGFLDNRFSDDEKIAMSMCREFAIKSAKNRKFVILTSYAELTDGGRGKLFDELSRLLSELFDNPDEMAKSVVWGITKVNDKDLTVNYIMETLHGDDGKGGMLAYLEGAITDLAKNVTQKFIRTIPEMIKGKPVGDVIVNSVLEAIPQAMEEQNSREELRLFEK